MGPLVNPGEEHLPCCTIVDGPKTFLPGLHFRLRKKTTLR
jgi:hypothetical protein